MSCCHLLLGQKSLQISQDDSSNHSGLVFSLLCSEFTHLTIKVDKE